MPLASVLVATSTIDRPSSPSRIHPLGRQSPRRAHPSQRHAQSPAQTHTQLSVILSARSSSIMIMLRTPPPDYDLPWRQDQDKEKTTSDNRSPGHGRRGSPGRRPGSQPAPSYGPSHAAPPLRSGLAYPLARQHRPGCHPRCRSEEHR